MVLNVEKSRFYGDLIPLDALGYHEMPQQGNNLKSLGSDTVPVQVRSAAPSLCDEKEYMQKKSDYSDFFVAQTPKFFRVKPWMFFEKKRYGTGFKLTLLRI